MKKFFTIVILTAALVVWRSFFSAPDYYFRIPIESINQYQLPCACVEIQGNPYSVEIDLGSRIALTLNQNILEKIKKSSAGTSRRRDFRGNEYETPLYLVPKIKVGDLLLDSAKAREESPDFVSSKGSIIWENQHAPEPHPIIGRMGREIFSGKNLLIDISNMNLIVCDDKKKIQIADPISLPFENALVGIILKIETDTGTHKFLLDTGCTTTVFRASPSITPTKERNGIPVFESSKFVMAGFDFGEQDLYLIDLHSTFNEIDGLLGMDFIKDHAIYLDFKTNTAYISRPQM